MSGADLQSQRPACHATIRRAGRERIDDLKPLWESLHRHHAAVAPELRVLGAVRPDAESWAVRRALYEAWLGEPDAFVLGPRRKTGRSDTPLSTCAARRRHGARASASRNSRRSRCSPTIGAEGSEQNCSITSTRSCSAWASNECRRSALLCAIGVASIHDQLHRRSPRQRGARLQVINTREATAGSVHHSGC